MDKNEKLQIIESKISDLIDKFDFTSLLDDEISSGDWLDPDWEDDFEDQFEAYEEQWRGEAEGEVIDTFFKENKEFFEWVDIYSDEIFWKTIYDFVKFESWI